MSEEIVVAPKKRVFARIAIVRLLVFFFVLGLAYGLSQFGMMQLSAMVPKSMLQGTMVAAAVLFSVLMVSIYALLVGWMERRGVPELAIWPGASQLVGGIVLTFVMFCVGFGVFWKLGNAQWLGIRGFDYVLSFAAIALLSGVGEEILFRGGIFRVLEDSFGTGVALLLSAALFGLMHHGNPNATLFSSIAIALEAGVLLGAAYAYTRNLWLPIGMHIGWNFTEGGVFGAALSGFPGGRGILNMPLTGPDLITGGQFGPEASVVALAVCTAVGLFFVVQTIRKGRWVRASFHMMLD